MRSHQQEIDMRTVARRLILDVVYDASECDDGVAVAQSLLLDLAGMASNRGLLSGDSPLTVETYSYRVEPIPDEAPAAAEPVVSVMDARTMCEVSTGNITEEDMALLEDGDALGLGDTGVSMLRAPYAYGAVVGVPEVGGGESGGPGAAQLRQALIGEGFSDLFVDVLDAARAGGFEFVMFDRDARYATGLRTRDDEG
jgi:hypothetical protein